jgi:organic radical activating enzyme
MVKILKTITTSFIDYPDADSISICVCFMGCVNGCKGCQNPEFQNHNLTNEFTRDVTIEEMEELISLYCKKNKTNKVVLSGGDPLSPQNIEFTKVLLKNNNSLDICIYTGHNIEYVKNNNVKGFKFVKCGKFDITNYRASVKTDDQMIFASPNQKLYDGKYELVSVDGVYKFN